jgi:hypothetical protein
MPRIAPILEGVPHYDNYGTSHDLARHFEDLAKGSFRGVTVENTVVGRQEAEGQSRPLIKSIIDLGGAAHTTYFKRNVHNNELVGQRTQEYISEQACRQPDFFRRMEVSRLVFLDVDPIGADLNTWHFYPPSLFRYFFGVRRSLDQCDWDYPVVENNEVVYESRMAACIASQKIIQEEQPDLVAPQHNAVAGSYFSYVLGAPPDLPPVLSAFMKKMYSDYPPAPPDFPDAKKLAEGVYEAPGWEALRTLYAGFGENSLHYAKREAEKAGRVSPAGWVVESPYFLARSLADNRLINITNRQSHMITARRGIETVDTADKYLKLMDIDPGSPEWSLYNEARLYTDTNQGVLTKALERNLEKPDAKATIGSIARDVLMNNLYKTVPLGMVANLAQATGSPHAPQIVARLRQEASFLGQALNLRPESPRRLVQAQLGAILLNCLSLQAARS